jgi:uncharacterized protein YjbJ (UPF0337 family)
MLWPSPPASDGTRSGFSQLPICFLEHFRPRQACGRKCRPQLPVGVAFRGASVFLVPSKTSSWGERDGETGLHHCLLKENTMDEHRVAGAVKNAGGKIEEGVGRVTGDTASQFQGVVDQVQGTAENLYGQAKDVASNTAKGVRKTASSFEDVIRHTIEDKPYTAITVALALGWLVGRMHRPL